MKDTEQYIAFGGKSIRESFKDARNRVCTETTIIDDDTRDDLHSTSLNLLDLDQLASPEQIFSDEREANDVHKDMRDNNNEDEDEIMLYNDCVQGPPMIKRLQAYPYASPFWQETCECNFCKNDTPIDNVRLPASLPSRSAFRNVSVVSKETHSIENLKPFSKMQFGKGGQAPESMKAKAESSLEKWRRLRSLGLNKKSCFKNKFSFS